MKTGHYIRAFSLTLSLGLLLSVVGCQTNPDDRSIEIYNQISRSEIKETTNASKMLILGEGDVVKITFPGAPDLDSVQQIRRDGRITMQLIGEMRAAGMSPTDLEKEIIRLYGAQLVAKEVMVTVNSSSFPIFVSGAVLRPGKIMSDRPITALQSIMESGGFDHVRANLKAVRVIREEDGKITNYEVNLKLPFQGKGSDRFELKPNDIVYVPERFTWF